jgi:hypothetical protein
MPAPVVVAPTAIAVPPVAPIAVGTPASAYADGTNAEPKSPASKLAVATAVANFFLMN